VKRKRPVEVSVRTRRWASGMFVYVLSSRFCQELVDEIHARVPLEQRHFDYDTQEWVLQIRPVDIAELQWALADRVTFTWVDGVRRGRSA
jgi:hypothetical protein